MHVCGHRAHSSSIKRKRARRCRRNVLYLFINYDAVRGMWFNFTFLQYVRCANAVCVCANGSSRIYDVRAYDRTEFISPVQFDFFLISKQYLLIVTISRKAGLEVEN